MIIATYDGQEAVEAYLSKTRGPLLRALDIVNTRHIDTQRILIQTADDGDFICQSFEDENATVFMEVHEVYMPHWMEDLNELENQ